jgi:hypothetical protein
VSLVIPLLLVGAGFDIILDRKIRGIAWLLGFSLPEWSR